MNTAQLTEAIDAAVVRLEQGDVKSDTERQNLLAAARRLQGAAEGPIESVASVSFDVSQSHTIPYASGRLCPCTYI